MVASIFIFILCTWFLVVGVDVIVTVIVIVIDAL